MKNLISTSLLFLFSFAIMAQSAYALEFPKIANPFAAPIAVEDEGKPTDIIYGELVGIPIPAPMLYDNRISEVTTVGGEKIGLESYTGRLEIESLNETMRENMRTHDWTLIAAIDTPKHVQIYEKNGLLAVISLSKLTINTGLEVAVMKAQNANLFTNTVNTTRSAVDDAIQTYSEELKD